MNIPGDLLYSESHEWVKKLDNGNVLVGITDHAQHKLTDIVFVNLCAEGEKLSAHSAIGDVESIKAVSEVFSPVGGTAVKVNQAVLDDPSLLNSDPYGSWLVELSGVSDIKGLVSAKEYEEIVKADV